MLATLELLAHNLTSRQETAVQILCQGRADGQWCIGNGRAMQDGPSSPLRRTFRVFGSCE